MVIRQETTVTFRFTDLSQDIQRLDEPLLATVTEVELLWTEDGGLPLEDEESPFFNYEIRGRVYNLDGVCIWNRALAGLAFPVFKDQWEFLSGLAQQIDHPGIRTAIAQRLAQAIENR